MLTLIFILELLRLMLNMMFFATYLKLASKLISISNVVVRKKVFSGTMLDPELSISLNRFTHKWGDWSIWRKDFPNSVIVAIGTQAHFSITRETGEY